MIYILDPNGDALTEIADQYPDAVLVDLRRFYRDVLPTDSERAARYVRRMIAEAERRARAGIR